MVFGVISARGAGARSGILATARSGRMFGPPDLALGEELASRAAQREKCPDRLVRSRPVPGEVLGRDEALFGQAGGGPAVGEGRAGEEGQHAEAVLEGEALTDTIIARAAAVAAAATLQTRSAAQAEMVAGSRVGRSPCKLTMTAWRWCRSR